MTPGLVSALAAASDTPLVHLLGHPRLSHRGAHIPISESGSRVLAFLCVNRGANDRRYVAEVLWPDVDELRAAGNLRTVLWRLNSAGLGLVEAGRHVVRLGADVQVDVHLLAAWTARVLTGRLLPTDLSHSTWDVDRLDMLPGWQDDWILLERERLRERMLRALVVLARALGDSGRCAEAIDAALLAVRSDPLRESAQRMLIEAFVAEGNIVEAKRRFDEYRATLRRELGVGPSPELAALVGLVPVGPVPVGRGSAVV